MPSASFSQQLRALVLRDLREMMVNPVGAGYVLAMLFFVLVTVVVLGVDDPAIAPLASAMAVCTALSTLTTTPTVFIFSEEWEHGTFLPLAMAGIPASTIVLARLIASVAGTLVHCALSLYLMSLVSPAFAADLILPLTAACIPAALTASAVSLGLALMARSQERIYACCAPVLVLGLICSLLQPLLEIPAFELLPMGPAVAATLQAAHGIAPGLGWLPLVASSAAWFAVALAVLAAGGKSFERALASGQRGWAER